MTGNVVPLAKTPDQLRVLADEMALRFGVTVAEVAAIAWDGHTAESLVAAWDDFRQAVRDREALATGHRVWQHYYDPEDCQGQDHAIELKQSESDDAYQMLMTGPRRVRG